MKKHVDQFKPGQSIPHCHLNAKLTSNHEVSPPELLHQVKLVGAKDPFKFITLNLVLQQTLPGQNARNNSLTPDKIRSLCARDRSLHVLVRHFVGAYM